MLDSWEHSPTDDGPRVSWSLSWSVEGPVTVELFDRNADVSQPTYLVSSHQLECAVPSTTAAPEPTVTVALEPDTTTATATTEVVLNTAPVPQQEPTVFVFPEELYSAEPSTTTLAEPVGCCSDYVGDVTATTVVPMLPATGASAALLAAVGFGVLALGVAAVLVARRPRRA